MLVLQSLNNLSDDQTDYISYSARRGTIVDATIVNAPVQHNTRSENKQVKGGEIPEEWKENPAKLSQKDVEARWGNKHGSYTFGYKAHVATDVKYKLIRDVVTTSAEVHNSNGYGQLVKRVKNTSKDVYANSGYAGSSERGKNGPKGPEMIWGNLPSGPHNAKSRSRFRLFLEIMYF